MKKIVFALLFFIPVLFMACKSDDTTFRIAEQWGLAYFPLQIIQEEKLLQRFLPDIEVKWVKMNNAAAIREAMLADRLDAGFMGIPPFLIGRDKGMKWDIFCGLSSAPLGLVVSDPSIQNLSDFSNEHRIALPQPGSIQHILLSMACDRQLGDAGALDKLLVTMSHPDGMNALLAGGEITGHFTSPPYLFQERELPGYHTVLSGREAFGGEFTFIVGVVRNAYADDSEEIITGLIKAVEAACAYIRKNPREAAAAGSRLYELPQDEFADYLADPEMIFSTNVQGVETFKEFMKGQNYLSASH